MRTTCRRKATLGRRQRPSQGRGPRGSGSVSDDALVSGNAEVLDSAIYGKAEIGDNAWVGSSDVSGEAEVFDNAKVSESEIYDYAHVYEKADVENSEVHESARCTETLRVYGCTINGDARIFGAAELRGGVLVKDDAQVYGERICNGRDRALRLRPGCSTMPRCRATAPGLERDTSAGTRASAKKPRNTGRRRAPRRAGNRGGFDAGWYRDGVLGSGSLRLSGLQSCPTNCTNTPSS